MPKSDRKPKLIERILTPVVTRTLHAAYVAHKHAIACDLDLSEEEYYALVRDVMQEEQK